MAEEKMIEQECYIRLPYNIKQELRNLLQNPNGMGGVYVTQDNDLLSLFPKDIDRWYFYCNFSYN